MVIYVIKHIGDCNTHTRVSSWAAAGRLRRLARGTESARRRGYPSSRVLDPGGDVPPGRAGSFRRPAKSVCGVQSVRLGRWRARPPERANLPGKVEGQGSLFSCLVVCNTPTDDRSLAAYQASVEFKPLFLSIHWHPLNSNRYFCRSIGIR